MRKTTCLFILLGLLINVSFAQKIKVNEIDKFTGKRRVETDYAVVGIKFLSSVSMKLRAVDTTIFITLAGNWAVGVVGVDDKSMFLFEDKSTVSIFPTGVQSYDVGTGQYSVSTYNHQYSISLADLKHFSEKKIVSLRREFNNNYDDIDVKEKYSKKIKVLVDLFLAELNKN